MKLMNFRVDTRKKRWLDRDVYDYIAMGCDAVPQVGAPVAGAVGVNFPPDLEPVEKRLGYGGVKFERKDIRHPENNKLQAIRFEYLTASRGYTTVTADHEAAQLNFRLANINGFESLNASWEAGRIRIEVMDELAKLVLGRPGKFL